jgi:hypothetical protein
MVWNKLPLKKVNPPSNTPTHRPGVVGYRYRAGACGGYNPPLIEAIVRAAGGPRKSHDGASLRARKTAHERAHSTEP